MVREFCDNEHPAYLAAYTRNPALLKAVGAGTRHPTVLRPSGLVVPHAQTMTDGHTYHIGRYAPQGLYGSFDPADREYQGQPLKQQCAFLQDPTNALAISVKVEQPR